MRYILGISAFYHDSAAALLRNGSVVAAAQNERFSRIKNDAEFPNAAIEYCLRHEGISLGDLDAIAFYDKPITKFVRMLESFLAIAPRGALQFARVLPDWFSDKLNVRHTIQRALPGLDSQTPILFTQHHQAHAASAFFPSPFAEAAILTVDGVGEWATTTIGRGIDRRVELIKEIRFPHSLGLLYSAFTGYLGFRVNSGEYKVMGLAPYGVPRFADVIRDHLLELKPDGSFRLNMDYFAFLHGRSMVNARFHRLFGGPPRGAAEPIDQRHMDVAASIQETTNTVMLALARHAREVTQLNHLCLAGGVALNCVANGLIERAGLFERVWIQPAAGDAGGALGAALTVFQERNDTGSGRKPCHPDAMSSALLGPRFSDEEIETALQRSNAVYEKLPADSLTARSARLLADGEVVGWFQGRMEFGPRALGNRSILGDPRSTAMQSLINRKVKYRESFRPFAPAVTEERASEFFELNGPSPYMLVVAKIHENKRLSPAAPTPDQGTDSPKGFELLREPRSTIPAVTHVDDSARVQTVNAESNPLFYRLLRDFESLTGCPLLINTSFNIRGEPIVCTPDDAYRCFLKTRMDWLIIGTFLLKRSAQAVPVPDDEPDSVALD